MPFESSSSFARYSGLPPRRISVPLPAIFVAIVTAPTRPAWAIIYASFWWCLAFNTLCFTPTCFKSADINSDFSILMVPTKTGRPILDIFTISSTTSLYFVTCLLKIASGSLFLISGLFVGIAVTGRL